ncbi:MAG: hypothetical protein LBC02_02595 [Planctomycetaceae bacterium]|jgi:hypothetical protein|nr:hypothetical protein [Planctomycetaceae bacterium]
MLWFVRFYQREIILYVVLLFLIDMTGCHPATDSSINNQNGEQSIMDAAAEANVRFEITNLHAENNISTNWEEERTKAQKLLSKLLLEIDQIPDVSARDLRYKTLVQQLIYEYRFAEAVNVAVKIQDKTIKDALLEDIVRFQIKDVWQTYQKTAGIYNSGGLSKEILEQIELATKTAGLIDNPLRQAESFENIALFRMKMKDRDRTVKMMNDAAESCRNLKKNEIQKAQGLCLFANWFLREENKEKTFELCKETESVLAYSKPSFDSMRIDLDISAIYILLDLEEPARLICEKAEKSVAQISEPHEKATILLKLAESLLVIRMKDHKIPLADRILSIKKLVLEAAEILTLLPDRETETDSIPNQLSESLTLPSQKNVFPENQTKFRPLSRSELVHFKNGLLSKIASMQAWGVPLEDVWETIEDIDPGEERDNALVAVIDMMIITHSPEDIEAWAEEIVDPMKKNSVLKKLK